MRYVSIEPLLLVSNLLYEKETPVEYSRTRLRNRRRASLGQRELRRAYASNAHVGMRATRAQLLSRPMLQKNVLVLR